MSPTFLYIVVIAVLAVLLFVQKNRERILLLDLEKNLRERKTVFAFLNNIGEKLTTETIALDPALEIINEFIVTTTDAEGGAIFLLDPETKVLSARVVHGLFPPLGHTASYALTKQKYLAERVKKDRIPLGQGLIGGVAESATTVLITDGAADPRIPQEAHETLPIRTMMAAPLRTHGQVVGVVAVVNKRGVGAFSAEDKDQLIALADQAASTVEMVKLTSEIAAKQRIEQELAIAHEFQAMLLPSEIPDVPGLDIAAYSEPALEVGGDYYDFFFVDMERRYLGVVVADVSGKGIPGAFVMAMVRCTLRSVSYGNLSPKDVLMRTNERLYADTKENVFVTMTYGILDLQEHTYTFARAGHEPLVTLTQDEEPVRLTMPDGIAVGMVDNEMFEFTEEKTIRLAFGELVVLYTDGVVEAMDAAKQEYTQQRFFDFLAANRSDSAKEIIEKTLQDIRGFTRGVAQHDDITMVTFRLRDVASHNELKQQQAGA